MGATDKCIEEGGSRIQYDLDRKDEGVVVMGTGTGKSSIFQTVALMEGERFKNALNSSGSQGIMGMCERKGPPATISVVPLVSLIEHHLQECEKISGLRARGWNQRNDPRLQLLFVSVEQTSVLEFINLLVTLSNDGRLGPIFVDEFRTTCHWCVFLLSAIIPPFMVEEIARMHGLLRGYRVLRMASTSRKNFSYHVVKAEPPLFRKPDAALVEATRGSVWNEVFRTVSDTVMMSTGHESDVSVVKKQLVIYCPTRKLVDSMRDSIESDGRCKPGDHTFSDEIYSFVQETYTKQKSANTEAASEDCIDDELNEAHL